MMIHIIITLALIGFIMWLVNTYVPMVDPYKKIFNIVVLVLVVLWLLSGFGFLDDTGFDYRR
jgi:hypothetical protein